MKINVNYDLCEANGVCVKILPEVFSLDDDDNLHLATDTPDEALRAKVEKAVVRCPKQALSLE